MQPALEFVPALPSTRTLAPDTPGPGPGLDPVADAPAPRPLDLDALRLPGERTMLRRTLFALGALYLLCTGLTLSLFLAWLVLSVLTVRVLRSRFQSDSIEVGPEQAPELHALVGRAAARLGVERPGVFLVADPGPWPIFTLPLPRPSLVMSAWWVKHLAPDELAFFVYHELAHQALGHRLVLNPVNALENVGAVSWILATPLEVARYALRPWMRLADFSADRIALACVVDLRVAARALAKATAGDELAETVRGDAFLEQARRLEGGWALYLHEITSGRLGAARRLGALDAFAASDDFQRLVLGSEPPPRLPWWRRLFSLLPGLGA